jgi:hypothetical protein
MRAALVVLLVAFSATAPAAAQWSDQLWGGSGGGGGGAAGPPGSISDLDPSSTLCSQTLPLRWSTDTDTGLVRSGADQADWCVGATMGLRLTTAGIVLNGGGDYIQFSPSDVYRRISVKDSVGYPGNQALTLSCGFGSGTTPYCEADGHLSVVGETLARDALFVWGDSGTAVRIYRSLADPTLVIEMEQDGQIFFGGGTQAAPGLAFMVDMDGSPTGWYRDALDSWMFERSGANLWRLREDWMPQLDVQQSIGSASARLLNLHVRNLVSEGLSVRDSTGAVEIASLNSAGRLTLVSTGSGASLPFIRGSDADTGFFLANGTSDWGFARDNSEVFRIDGGALLPAGDGAWGLGGVSSSNVATNFWQRVAAANMMADGFFLRSDFDAQPSGLVRTAANVLTWRSNSATIDMVNLDAAGLRPGLDNYASAASATNNCLNGSVTCSTANGDRRWTEMHAQRVSAQRMLYNAPQTCDCGTAGTPNTVTCDITASVVYLVDGDADACTVTIGETTAAGQDVPMDVTIYVASTGTGGAFTINDAAGVVELSAAWTADVVGESLTLHFLSQSATNTFVETARQTGL